jgi:hypothetical protein
MYLIINIVNWNNFAIKKYIINRLINISKTLVMQHLMREKIYRLIEKSIDLLANRLDLKSL